MSFSVKCFRDNGAIASKLETYETRLEQIEMVQAVEEAIASGSDLIVEAGPGVGKSLAYLVPFIHWAVTEGKRVMVSTYTKALQNQLFVKDLPFLKEALGLDLRYVLCMGSDNYVCLKKAYKTCQGDLFEGKYHKRQADRILEWINTTDTGLVSDMEVVPDQRVWDNFKRDSDLCGGRKCPHFEDCFYMTSRREQAKAHVLVVNHALFFTSLGSETNLFGDVDALVLDEAHTLEDVATNYFGKTFSSSGIVYLVDKIRSFLEGDTPRPGEEEYPASEAENVKKGCSDLIAASESFFGSAEEKLFEKDSAVEFSPETLSCDDVMLCAQKLLSTLLTMAGKSRESALAETVGSYAARVKGLCESISAIFDPPKSGWVFWAQARTSRSARNIAFHASPVDIRDRMRKEIFENFSPVVLASATLSVSGRAGDLTFIKERLGMDEAMDLVVDSPFDYGKNVLVYLPHGAADPSNDSGAFRRYLKDNIISIYDVMGGRIFALFTSYNMLDSVAAGIAADRPDIYILKQGDMPRYVLLDVFKKNNSSMLLGTTTFWQGVDVPGSALECVIITKLPFGVPSDPVNAARIRALREKGHNPFREYQLPQAMIMFKQGFGRLIRSRSDRGVFAVLDPRVRTREYGRKFLEYVPECRITGDLDEVRDFFISPRTE
jgi:ATP-dependent DNA helicase DinG